MKGSLGFFNIGLTAGNISSRGCPRFISGACLVLSGHWIVISSHGIPDWAGEGEICTVGAPFRVTDAEAQIVAARQGLGITTLPCFVGDADPSLARTPGADLNMYGTLWLLTHGETRKTERVRLFTEFMSRRLAAYSPLLAGLLVPRD